MNHDRLNLSSNLQQCLSSRKERYQNNFIFSEDLKEK